MFRRMAQCQREKFGPSKHTRSTIAILSIAMGPSKKRRRLSEDGKSQNMPNEQNASDESTHSQTTIDLKQQRRTIFVRSLPTNTTTETLLAHFSESLPVKHATAVIDPTTKNCKGFGFVTFADPEDAGRAISEFNDTEFEGKRLKIEIAEPRHRDEESGTAKVNDNGTARKPSKAKGRDRDPDAKPPRLIIRNLPWSIKEPDQLGKLFLSYGKVKSAVLPKKKNGIMSGFGFILLRGRKNADKAIAGLNGKEIDGRTIAVDWAVDKGTWEHQKESLQEEQESRNGNKISKNSAEDADEEDSEGSHKELSQHEDDDQSADDMPEDDSHDTESAVNGVTPNSHQTEKESVLFIRNLPFGCTDEDLYDHFSQFGRIRYARVVLDSTTERSRGTGFVSFVYKVNAIACLKNAPRHSSQQANHDSLVEAQSNQSVLQNDTRDASGNYTIDGRVLHVSRAMEKSDAQRLTLENKASRNQHPDKRHLYLLSEGTISSKSPLYKHLAPSEVKMREASAKQRQKLIESNPSLHLSLTRLSVRNIPRTITSKDLKALAREAVVGFATDVKSGSRQPLSKEETEREAEEMREAERSRKKKGKGLVKQAKIVFEGREGSKVSEASGAGRSRGYGFIEYYTHRSALMGLRWLNGHAIAYNVNEDHSKNLTKEDVQDRKRRLIVEFAIENVQVVSRRKDREVKARERAKIPSRAQDDASGDTEADDHTKVVGSANDRLPKKRKRGNAGVAQEAQPNVQSKHASRQQIIARKRLARKQRKEVSKT